MGPAADHVTQRFQDVQSLVSGLKKLQEEKLRVLHGEAGQQPRAFESPRVHAGRPSFPTSLSSPRDETWHSDMPSPKDESGSFNFLSLVYSIGLEGAVAAVLKSLLQMDPDEAAAAIKYWIERCPSTVREDVGELFVRKNREAKPTLVHPNPYIDPTGSPADIEYEPPTARPTMRLYIPYSMHPPAGEEYDEENTPFPPDVPLQKQHPPHSHKSRIPLWESDEGPRQEQQEQQEEQRQSQQQQKVNQHPDQQAQEKVRQEPEQAQQKERKHRPREEEHKRDSYSPAKQQEQEDHPSNQPGATIKNFTDVVEAATRGILKAGATDAKPATKGVRLVEPEQSGTRSVKLATSLLKKKVQEKQLVIREFYNDLAKEGFCREQIDDCEIVRLLGKGSQSTVYHMKRITRDEETGEETTEDFARKIVMLDAQSCESHADALHRTQQLRTEIQISRFNCPYILRSLHIWSDGRKEVDIDMPLMVSDLDKLMKAYLSIDGHSSVPEAVVAQVIRQVILALEFLHSKKGEGGARFIHRDLKPENILLNRQGEAKLTDFGVAKGVSSVADQHTFIGNFAYMAPEVMDQMRSGHYSTPADMWSVGMVTFHMLLGRYPIPGSLRGYDLCQKISTRFEWTAQGPIDCDAPNTSDESKDFLSRMLLQDPSKRMSAETALNHPFMMRAQEPARELTEWVEECLPRDQGG